MCEAFSGQIPPDHTRRPSATFSLPTRPLTCSASLTVSARRSALSVLPKLHLLHPQIAVPGIFMDGRTWALRLLHCSWQIDSGGPFLSGSRYIHDPERSRLSTLFGNPAVMRDLLRLEKASSGDLSLWARNVLDAKKRDESFQGNREHFSQLDPHRMMASTGNCKKLLRELAQPLGQTRPRHAGPASHFA